MSSLIRSFGYAFEGIWHAVRNNLNLRIDIFAALVVIILAIFFSVTPFEMSILGLMILLVIASEMINTAIEEMVDLIVTVHRREAKAAKDVAAGMVLVVAIGAAIAGILIFAPYVLNLFK
ncbi:MAG: diacylglycerol kinase family protein [bacterium]|nr:diacylglycerol kinase family protein [bacterium]